MSTELSTEAAYVRPHTVDEAVAVLASGGFTVLAGGTDFYPSSVGTPISEPVIDITALSELRGIGTDEGGAVRIGALSTWTDVIEADLPPAFDGLKAAAQEVGGVQIQNVATVAGNLCNASPAADGVPPLLTLDAEVEARSSEGRRIFPLADFLTGYRQTALAPNELVTAVIVPEQAASGSAAFLKLGARRHLVISIAMVAVRLATDADGNIQQARVAVGACSPVAMRLTSLESALENEPLAADLPTKAAPEHLSTLTPIDDVRAPAEYRRRAAFVLVRRALARAAEQA